MKELIEDPVVAELLRELYRAVREVDDDPTVPGSVKRLARALRDLANVPPETPGKRG